jgi:amidohydrolase
MTMVLPMRSVRALAVWGLAVASCGAAPAQVASVSPRQAADAATRASALYRELHESPELSLQEAKTSARLAGELTRLGFEVHRNVGGHGVVGLLRNGSGKTLMLRTDMDALPVEEQTDSPAPSRVRAKDEGGSDVPVMHACGHDLHMAAWVGAAELLSRRRAEWAGTLMLVAQPAEERLVGARAMLEDGLFMRFPKPDLALAIHVHDQLALGTVGYTVGPFAASADSLDLEVHGRGGHGAYPQSAIDPVVIAARIVTTLQTIASREANPSEPVVVSVGSIHGGNKHNTIPESVKLQLTVRTYGVETRKRVLAAIERIVNAEAAAANAPRPPTLTITEGTAAAVNDPLQTRAAVAALRGQLPPSALVELPPEMGSEDFGEYARAGVPTVMLQVGVVEPTRFAAARATGDTLPPIHSGRFLPAPGSLAQAIQIESVVALAFLTKSPPRR